MWFYSGHANIYVSKREARSERITGFGCDTGFGARDVDLLFALPEPACTSLNQSPSPLCPQLPSATADFSPFWGISFMGLGQVWGEKGAFQLNMKIWVPRWCSNRGKLWQFELRRAPPKFVQCPARCAWFAGVCSELLQPKQWSAFSK